MDRQDDAQYRLPKTWRLENNLAYALVLEHAPWTGQPRKEAKDIAEETVYAKLNEERDAWACATGGPGRVGLVNSGGGTPAPPLGTIGVWIRHSNPKLPGACWYPGYPSFVLTGNTLSTMSLNDQGAVHSRVTPDMPHVNHPTPIHPDGGEVINACTNSPTLCNPDPRPPVDPTLDKCFWDGDCTDF